MPAARDHGAEVGKTPLSSPEQVEYFFHRMFSLMRIIMRATGRG